MPSVVTYYQLADEESALIQYLEQFGDLVVVPRSIPDGLQCDLPMLISALARYSCLRSCQIAKASQIIDVAEVRRHIESRTMYVLPDRTECVVYQRPSSEDRELAQTNMFAYWEYLSDDRTELIPKSSEFRKWAGKVFSWVRRHTPDKVYLNGYPYRATPAAAKACAEGKLKAIF